MAMVFAIVNVVREHLDDANAKRRNEIVAQRESAKDEEQRLEMVRGRYSFCTRSRRSP